MFEATNVKCMRSLFSYDTFDRRFVRPQTLGTIRVRTDSIFYFLFKKKGLTW